MANSIYRASILQSQLLFQPSLSNRNSVPKKSNLLCSASSQLNPVRLEVSFHIGTHLIPHPNKVLQVERGGEDAFFVSNFNGGVITVADGVSVWAEQNVDPSLFSKELMANASSLLGDVEVNYNPQILLRKAHAATSSKGSATAIVAILERNVRLEVATVGDCGLRIIPKGQVIFSTSPQEHYFDFPYQLSSELIGQTYLDAVASSVELVEGDTIEMGSDGLFDSVFDREIVSTLAIHTDVVEGLDVPFWKKILGMKLTGGKLDDITVIVSQVVTSPSTGILDEVPKTEEVRSTESIGISDEVQMTEKIEGTESIVVLKEAQITEGVWRT